MQELNYISFESEFVKFCSGFFNTLLETDGIVKPTRENVDRYILLSAAMTKEEEVELLGRDRSSFDKTALSKMRTGERPVVKGIVETFSRDKAIYFSLLKIFQWMAKRTMTFLALSMNI